MGCAERMVEVGDGLVVTSKLRKSRQLHFCMDSEFLYFHIIYIALSLLYNQKEMEILYSTIWDLYNKQNNVQIKFP